MANNNPIENAVETFAAPMESVIVALGQSISEAQRALDQNSIQTQQAIDSDPEAAAFGLKATWYQFPRVELQLKLAVSVTETKTAPATPPAAGIGLTAILRRPFRLFAQPVNAGYQNTFNYNAEASSIVTLSIVPVPAPGINPPQLNAADVQDKALGSPAKFATTQDAQGNIIPDPKRSLDIHFNAAARLWYVLQYDAGDPNFKPVLVTVDDGTGAVKVISTS